MKIDGTTRVVGVIGDPVSHTLSPAMHNAAFKALGLNWVYVAWHVAPEGVESAVNAVRGLCLTGMNVTVPHKKTVIPFLDELSPAAKAVGAVNTIVNRGGQLLGDNTDVYGILQAIRVGAKMDTVPPVVVVLGAGGAARGIVYALTTLPEVKSIRILNRTLANAEELAREFGTISAVTAFGLEPHAARHALDGCGLLINATNLGRGTLADVSPLPDAWNCIPPRITCIDSNYSPATTRLMEQVVAAGGIAFNGLDMLVYQGARAFELWTGVKPPVDVMRAAANARLQGAPAHLSAGIDRHNQGAHIP